MTRLEGKVALVTGAGSNGIGRRIALAFAAEGADVAVHYRTSEAGARVTADRITSSGRRCTAVMADLRDPGSARAAVRTVVERLGRVDILVSNIGIVPRTPFLEITDEEWDDVLHTNLRSYFACGQEAARDMAPRGWGRVIAVSSVTQAVAMIDRAHYCASKGGVMQLAKAMALELAAFGVTVNLIAPGAIETDLNRTYLADPEFRRYRAGTIPMRRIGVPEDITAAALFLASDESSYLTGATITIDGGFTLP